MSKNRFAELENSKEFKTIKEKLTKKFNGFPLPKDFFKSILNRVDDLVKIDLRAILANAWIKSESLFEYTGTDKYAADESFYVPLAEHTIVSEHKPSLRPTINNVSLGEIEFYIYLELILKGAILRIQKGKIMEVLLDSCRAKGSISHSKVTILNKQIEDLKLTGSIKFGSGIPITKRAEEAYHYIDEILGSENNGADKTT